MRNTQWVDKSWYCVVTFRIFFFLNRKTLMNRALQRELEDSWVRKLRKRERSSVNGNFMLKFVLLRKLSRTLGVNSINRESFLVRKQLLTTSLFAFTQFNGVSGRLSFDNFMLWSVTSLFSKHSHSLNNRKKNSNTKYHNFEIKKIDMFFFLKSLNWHRRKIVADMRS